MNIKAALDFLQSAKAYVGTLVAVGGILLTLSADENFAQLVPETTVGKVAAIGTALVTFGAIFGVRNARTIEQAQADLERARQAETKRALKASRKMSSGSVERQPDSTDLPPQ